MADSLQGILVDEYIEVTVRPCDVSYYRNLGYDIPFENKKRTFFKIKIKTIDLPKYSTVKVKARCIRCGKIRQISFRSYSISSGLCGVCAKQDCQKKMTSANFGDKNINWKGGITHLHAFIRNTIDYKLWRFFVYERDLFTCKKCGKSGGELNCHHIQSFADIVENNSINKTNYMKYRKILFDVNNGITLCKECHSEYHILNGGMKKNKNKVPFFDWLKNKIAA